MKKEDIIQAINEVDDDLLESAQQARTGHIKKNKQSSMIRRTVISLTAMAAVIAAVMITNRRKPEETDPVTAVTPTPEISEPGEKAVLTLSHQNTAGTGMSVVMYPDLKEEPDYNPWNDSMNLTELPVYRRNMSITGSIWGPGEEELRSILKETADWFGFTLTEETVYKAGEYDERHRTYDHVPGVEDGTVLYIKAESEEAQLTCYGSGEVTVFFHEGHEPHVPQSLKMNVYDLSEEEAEKTAQYLADTYGGLLGEEETAWDIGGDYGYNRQPSEELGEKEGLFRIRHYWFWKKGNSDAETVVNSALNDLQIWGFDPDDDTLITGIRLRNRLRAYQKTDEYPLISAEEAYEQLLAGNCIANAGGILPDEKTETGNIDMVYRDDPSSQYVYPCYLFYMDITDALKEKHMMEIDGVRQYGLYWVPAIDPVYYEWSDEPSVPEEDVTPGTQRPEETVLPESAADAPPEPAETPAPQQPEETITPEPEITAVSNSISIIRSTQETSWYCSVACTQMILSRFGIYKEQNSLAAELNTYAPGIREDGIRGTYDTDVARVLNDYLFGGQPQKDTDGGYRVQPVSESFVQSEYSKFISRMRKNIDDGYPSILQVRVCDVYGGSTTENHNVIVSGYEEKDGNLCFTIVDPYFGGPSGTGLNTFSASALFSAIVNSVEPSYIW